MTLGDLRIITPSPKWCVCRCPFSCERPTLAGVIGVIKFRFDRHSSTSGVAMAVFPLP